jgi:hypothetical protein
MPRPPKLDRETLEAALIGFEQKRSEVDQKITELRLILNGREPQADGAAPLKLRHKRRKMSAAARKRMADGQRKRWAKVRVAKRELI